MTPTSSAATEHKLPKLIVVSLLGVVAASYLGAYFFLLFLKLAPTEASPLTMPRYAYYYWDNRDVRSRLLGAGALALLIVGGMALIVALPKRRSLHGDARWAKARHIRRAGLMADQITFRQILGADDDIGHQIRSAKLFSILRNLARPSHRKSPVTAMAMNKLGQ